MPLSRELFCFYAFYHPLPPQKFADLVDRFVTVCHGLPLSLKVFGALVCGEDDERYWEEQLDRLQQTLPAEILQRLRISYDSLSKQDQPIFLDIASFFIGEDRDTAIRIWGMVGIQNLENKCLLEVGSENEIKMHDHIRELARNIAADEGSMPLRLGHPTTNQIDDLLDQSLCRIMEVCGITMVDRLKFYEHKTCVSKISETSLWRFVTEDGGERVAEVCRSAWFDVRIESFSGMSPEMLMHMTSDMSWYKKWTDEVFGNCMRHLVNNSPTCGILNLRLIATEDGYLKLILKRARSPHLLWLRWYKCPYSCLPSWIPMENLRVLEVAGLKLKLLWERESQVPLQLRELNISAPLSSIPKTIGQLKLLEKIVIFHALLKSLPDEFCNLRSLKFLELRDCSRMMLLPESFGKLTNLQHINLSYASALQTLPLSFGKLIRLKHLDLTNCGNLTISNGNITRLDYLDLSNITTLEYMNLSGCKKVNELPSGIGDLYNLETLAFGSDLLKVLPVSVGFLESLTDLSLSDLPILKCLPDSIGLLTKLKKLHLWKCGIEYLPQNLMKLNNLEILRVEECPLLVLPFKKVEREMDRLLLFDRLDSSSDQCMLGLKELWLLHCTKISEVAFPKGVCPNLQVLSLYWCEELRQIAGLCGLAELQSLQIQGCANVEELPSLETLISLEELTVAVCQRLKSIRGLGQLTKLRQLSVDGCEEIQNLPTVAHLEKLQVAFCMNLKSIEELGQLTKLRLLKFNSCPNIRKLPGAQHLGSLEELSIYDCRNLESIQGLGQLTKLRLLDVAGCCKMQELPSVERLISLEEFRVLKAYKFKSIQGLGQLTKLRLLHVAGCCEMVELPGVERLISLEELSVSEAYKLKSIQGLGQLTKLRRLSINLCLEIRELPDVEQCSSLEKLDARDCPNLQWGEGVLEHLRQRLKDGLRIDC